MFPLVAAAIVSAFTLAGAHPVPVTCMPIVAQPGAAATWGITHNFVHPDDRSYWYTTSMELSPPVCGGLLLLTVDAPTRAAIARANPGVDVIEWESRGALVLMHESQHAAGVLDETTAECGAVRELPAFLAQHLSGAELTRVLNAALVFDASLGGAYHVRACA